MKWPYTVYSKDHPVKHRIPGECIACNGTGHNFYPIGRGLMCERCEGNGLDRCHLDRSKPENATDFICIDR